MVQDFVHLQYEYVSNYGNAKLLELLLDPLQTDQRHGTLKETSMTCWSLGNDLPGFGNQQVRFRLKETKY